jgi:hypothetical protein
MTTALRYSIGALLSVFGAGLLQAGTLPGFEALSRLDQIPALKTSVKIGSISSYDRTGGNDDGFSGKYSFVRKEPGTLILADLQGPGVIYRIWTPTPSDDMIEFLFDGETEPRIQIKFRDLFLGIDPLFPKPLSGFGVGGFYCYVPIPYAKSCIVRARAEKVQFYQINYAQYAPETPLKSFPAISPEDWQRGLAAAGKPWLQTGEDISSFTAPPGSATVNIRASVQLKPGQPSTLFETNSGGRILGLRLSPFDALASKKRDLLLRIAFDGTSPAVLCPVGDFFGCVWGQPAMRSLLLGNNGNTAYCYFPMPFDKAAKVEIVSERGEPVSIQSEVVYCPVARKPNEARFYALWRREDPTTEGQPFTFLDTTGRGHVVAVILQAQGKESGKTLFFEGDDQATIDGQLAIHGTGSEDFFNGGWYDVPDRWEKRLCFPLSGCLGYNKPVGRTAAYRLFLGDACSYKQSLKLTIEHSGEKNNIPTDYVSVTCFYSEQTPSVEIGVPPLRERAVVDPAEAIFPAWWQTPIYAWSFEHATLNRKKAKLGNDEVRYLSLVAEGSDWFGHHFYSPTVDLPATGTYAIYIEAVKGPEQGIVQLFENENPSGPKVDLYAESQAKSERLLLGNLRLSEGRNNLMIKLVGKNEKSKALGLDLVHLYCVLQEAEP